MNWATVSAAVIPAHNEEATIFELARNVRQYLPKVIVVDDGSTDQTSVLALKAGVQVVRHERNSGKGAALKTGIAIAVEHNFEWVLTLDGDGQHVPDDIPAFFRCAEETAASLVIGNRMHNAEAMPWVRRYVNQWMSRKISVLAGKSVPDSQCGFRLVNLKAWKSLEMKCDFFEIESEMLLSFVRAGHAVHYIPIKLIPRGLHSHIHPIRDTIRWIKWWKLSRKDRLPAK